MLYTACRNPRCYKVCCAVCTPLVCAGVGFVLFFCCCLDICFSNGHVILRNKQNAYDHILYTICTAYDTCVACLQKNRGRERFTVLNRVAAFVAFGCRCLCTARCIARSPASFGFRRSKLQNTTTTSPRLLFFCCRATMSNRSVFPQKILYKGDKALVGATSIFIPQTLPTDVHYVNLVLRTLVINRMKKKRKVPAPLIYSLSIGVLSNELQNRKYGRYASGAERPILIPRYVSVRSTGACEYLAPITNRFDISSALFYFIWLRFQILP